MLHHLHQPQLLTTFRYRHRYTCASLLLEPLQHHSAIIRLYLRDNLGGNVRRTFVELLQERTHHLTRTAIARALQDKEFSPDQLPAAKEKNLRARLILAAGQRNHILVILAFRVNNALLLQHLLNRLDTVAYTCCLLEVQLR